MQGIKEVWTIQIINACRDSGPVTTLGSLLENIKILCTNNYNYIKPNVQESLNTGIFRHLKICVSHLVSIMCEAVLSIYCTL